jgi:hypothetical protein
MGSAGGEYCRLVGEVLVDGHALDTRFFRDGTDGGAGGAYAPVEVHCGFDDSLAGLFLKFGAALLAIGAGHVAAPDIR